MVIEAHFFNKYSLSIIQVSYVSFRLINIVHTIDDLLLVCFISNLIALYMTRLINQNLRGYYFLNILTRCFLLIDYNFWKPISASHSVTKLQKSWIIRYMNNICSMLSSLLFTKGAEWLIFISSSSVSIKKFLCKVLYVFKIRIIYSTIMEVKETSRESKSIHTLSAYLSKMSTNSFS